MSRNVLITGVSTGIGMSFIKSASASYADDIYIALTRHSITYDVPKNVFVYNVDLTDFAAVTKIYKKIVRKHGNIDVLINNAGNGLVGTVEDTSISQAKSQFDLNVWAAVHLTQLVLPAMRKNKRGHIINISSVAAEFDYPTMAYYGASKTLLEKISRILSLELRPWNINVSIVAPGTIKTKFGSNMVTVPQAKTSPYQELYREWTRKFVAMFKRHIVSSDEVASSIIKVMDRPRAKTFVAQRDRVYTILHKHSSDQFFAKHSMQRYMSSK